MGVGPILNFKKKLITGRPKKQIRKNPETFCCRGHHVMLKRSCETVTFSELKHEELEALVKFIYSDGSGLSAKEKEHVRSLYVTADKYEIPHLRDLCRNELVKSLNLSNALEVLELSLIPLDNALHDAAFCYIINNLKTIANSLEFKLFATRNTDLTVEIIRAYMARRNIYY
ncbi:BnaA04g18000D [Brassica napus]|uniref:BnaA04g18000D protein n=2 Tax=Brassica napus TaxID=3708 RepID=A0A078FXF6_BRANA|nr:BnaA04g18000D [Brassica napus]